MRIIKEYVDRINDELDSAKEYSEKYVEYKARGDSSKAGHFKEMASDELKHAMFFHELATEEVERISRVYTPSVSMQEKWEHDHKRYVEDVAILKQILNM
jgi:ferritin